jgi:hypothetical protein
MTIDDLLIAVAAIENPPDLYRLISAAKQQLDEQQKARYAAAVAIAWERARLWNPGTEIWVCMEGTMLGGDLQRGDKLIVTHNQPRAKRIWARKAKAKGNNPTHCFEPAGIHRYNLQRIPPETPLPAEERRRAEQMARVTQDVFNK